MISGDLTIVGLQSDDIDSDGDGKAIPSPVNPGSTPHTASADIRGCSLDCC